MSRSLLRPDIQITPERASRLYRFILALSEKPLTREQLLKKVGVELRTFYRELDLLKQCGVRINLENRKYVLNSTVEEAEANLPFPDPKLSFAEMQELATYSGPAAQRLNEELEHIVEQASTNKSKRRSKRSSDRRIA